MGNRKVVNETRVLVVEDEDAVRELLVVTLEGAGYTPLPAGDVPEAERLMGERAPDLILLDWMLPGMSGIEFTRRLRKEPSLREVPIIMLTARGEEHSKVCGVGAMVETTAAELRADPSQGSHFFHNITTLDITYCTVDPEKGDRLDWAWITAQPGPRRPATSPACACRSRL